MLSKECLVCTRCQKEYPVERIFPRCDDCYEPLEVKISQPNKIRGKVFFTDTDNILSRYASFYSSVPIKLPLSLGEGFTPLVKANLLSELLDLDCLYLKNETVNPTWSFKDRGTLVALQHALSLGCTRIGTLSSGNMLMEHVLM